jgi:hypothetical protein
LTRAGQGRRDLCLGRSCAILKAGDGRDLRRVGRGEDVMMRVGPRLGLLCCVGLRLVRGRVLRELW